MYPSGLILQSSKEKCEILSSVLFKVIKCESQVYNNRTLERTNRFKIFPVPALMMAQIGNFWHSLLSVFSKRTKLFNNALASAIEFSKFLQNSSKPGLIRTFRGLHTWLDLY